MTVAELIKKNKANCCGCYACENACPHSAIRFEFDEEGFWYPIIDDSLCVQCDKCITVCPCVNIPAVLPLKETYACNAKDQEELMTSSSGGVFAVMARSVLREGGYVCGAVFDENFAVVHQLVDSETDLYRIKGTKYVQSKIGDIYSEIKELLDCDKTVLFSGTPCQTSGLLSFLRRRYENLITVDLICHGVPSPVIWKEYLKEISKSDSIVEVNFRNKNNGISEASIVFSFESGEKKQARYADNPFVKGFIRNYYLRPSCFECRFKGLNRCSDITIGDFWAVKEYYPDFDSQFGTSAVIIRTEKAKKLFAQISEQLCCISASPNQLLLWNECLAESVKQTEKRAEFYSKFHTREINELVEELVAEETNKSEKRSVFSLLKSKFKK